MDLTNMLGCSQTKMSTRILLVQLFQDSFNQLDVRLSKKLMNAEESRSAMGIKLQREDKEQIYRWFKE